MYEQDGKRYTVKLNDFADECGVSVRTVQKKLTADRYKSKLEGEFLRTGSDGTWLTEEGASFLRGTLKTKAVGFVSNERYEREIADLKRDLYETQKEYTAYVKNAAPLLLKASEQIALAERAGEYKEQIDALEAQNGEISADRDEWKGRASKAEKTAQEAAEKLTAYENMSVLGFIKQKLKRKNKENVSDLSDS